MTTNIGSTIIQDNFASLTDSNESEVLEQTKVQVFDLLKQSVRPEFLNRIDEYIMFSPLSKSDIRKIVDIQFRNVRALLEQNGIKLEATEKALNHIAKIGFDPQYGARPLKRVIQREILNQLSKDILSGKISKDGIVGIDLNQNNEIEFINLEDVEI